MTEQFKTTGDWMAYGFNGHTMSRDEFLLEFRDAARGMPWGGNSLTAAFVLFFQEMAKNAYDHGGKRCFLWLQHGSDDTIVFVFGDYGGRAHNWDYCRSHSSAVENGVNLGCGLGMITGMAGSMMIRDFTYDSSCGFVYSGTIPCTTSPG